MSVAHALYQAHRDRVLREQLVDDPGVRLAQKRIDDDTSGYGFFGRRELLTHALRVSRNTHSGLTDALALCRDTLGFNAPLEVFIKPSPSYGAFLLRSPTGPLALGVTSHLLEHFTPAELRFVVGHELGHAVFDHMALPMPLTAIVEDMAGPLVSRAIAIQLYLWCRSAEISADRAGLLCAGDLDAAAGAFFKISSGLTTAPVSEEMHGYLAQVDALAAAPVGRRKPRSEDDTLECFQTHPYAPLRLRALCAYARSHAFYTARELHGGTITLEQAEEIVEGDLDVMAPSYLEEKSEEADLLRRLLFVLGLQVAHAHDGVQESEVRALKALVGTDAFSREPTLAECEAEGAQKMQAAKTCTSRLRRTQLLQHLTLIAAADGHIHDSEAALLYRMAGTLDVPLRIVDETLRVAAHPLD